MTICAENLATKQIYSTHQHLKAKKYRYKVGYKLEVPPGDYHVYAQLPDPARYGAGYPKDYRAYYSEFVKCGMPVDCQSHAPIVVKVRAARPSAASTPRIGINNRRIGSVGSEARIDTDRYFTNEKSQLMVGSVPDQALHGKG